MDKKRKILGNILFWLTLISPIISFALVCEVGEPNIFDIAGITRYSWIMLLFIPIGFVSIIFGVKLKKNKQKYKKNFIISFICVPLLIIFGSYRFIFNKVFLYDKNEVSFVEEKIKLEIPNNIKVAKIKLESYNEIYIKIIDNYSKDDFENKIKNNQLWKDGIDIIIKNLLPMDIQFESETFEYSVFYNMTKDEYNMVPSSGEYSCIFIGYDSDLNRIIILDDYQINI